jgi:transitional endoplasmic reticulum ATPase
MNLQEQKEFFLTIQSTLEKAASIEEANPREAAELYLQISRKILDKTQVMTTDEKKKFMKIAESVLDKRDNIIKLSKERNERSNENLMVKNNRPHPDLNNTDMEGSSQFIKDLHPTIYETTFKDIAGLDEVKDTIIRQVIKARERPDLAIKYGITGRNILLFGPPGTGKTSIAQAISNEISFPMVTVTPSYILDNKFGAFEKNIRSLFEDALRYAPIIIFFDEFEALAPRRTSINSSYMKRGVPEMLRQMTDLRKKNDGRVILIGATNNPWDLDEAILNPDRFDTRIFIPPPDVKSRSQIFKIFLRELSKDENIDYGELGKISEGFSAADIKYVCRTAAEYAFSNAIDSGMESPITSENIKLALKSSHPSITEDQMKKYFVFMEKYVKKV